MNTGDYYPLYLKWNKIVSKYIHPHSHLKNPEKKEKEKGIALIINLITMPKECSHEMLRGAKRIISVYIQESCRRS